MRKCGCQNFDARFYLENNMILKFDDCQYFFDANGEKLFKAFLEENKIGKIEENCNFISSDVWAKWKGEASKISLIKADAIEKILMTHFSKHISTVGSLIVDATSDFVLNVPNSSDYEIGKIYDIPQKLHPIADLQSVGGYGELVSSFMFLGRWNGSGVPIDMSIWNPSSAEWDDWHVKSVSSWGSSVRMGIQKDTSAIGSACYRKFLINNPDETEFRMTQFQKGIYNMDGISIEEMNCEMRRREFSSAKGIILVNRTQKKLKFVNSEDITISAIRSGRYELKCMK
jgi:hypothetical protein